MVEVKVPDGIDGSDRKLWIFILSDIIDDCFVDWYSSSSLRRKYPSLDLYIAERLYVELELGSAVWEYE